MPESEDDPSVADDAGEAEGITEVRRQKALLKTGALHRTDDYRAPSRFVPAPRGERRLRGPSHERAAHRDVGF